MSFCMVPLVSPLQTGTGNAYGLSTRKHQPVRLAAMEGRWKRLNGRARRWFSSATTLVPLRPAHGRAG